MLDALEAGAGQLIEKRPGGEAGVDAHPVPTTRMEVLARDGAANRS